MRIVVWALFAACIGAISFAAWGGAHGTSAWFAAIVAVEVIVLVFNGWRCPLTSVAGRDKDEHHDNFDIYLPIWLARHNKLVFGALYLAGVAFALVRWMRTPAWPDFAMLFGLAGFTTGQPERGAEVNSHTTSRLASASHDGAARRYG